MASARDPASSVHNSAPGPVIPNAQMQEAVGQQQVKVCGFSIDGLQRADVCLGI